MLPGEKAFDLYATCGLPLEIIQDIARERGMDVEESKFREALEEHRLVSGSGEGLGPLGGEDAEIYRSINTELKRKGKLDPAGVRYNPYDR